MKIIVLIFAGLVSVFAEPPAYLYARNNVGVPNTPSHPGTTLDTQVSSDAAIKPNAQYGPASVGQQYDALHGGYAGGIGTDRYYGEEYNTVPANYNFEYHVYAPEYGNDFGHHEARQGDIAQGKYFVLLPDGRKQTVEYTADQNGYNPSIRYENNAFRGFAGGYSRLANFHVRNKNQNNFSSERYRENNTGYKY